jgi:hypothetical protein
MLDHMRHMDEIVFGGMLRQEFADVGFDLMQGYVPLFQIRLVLRGIFRAGNIGVTELQTRRHEPTIAKADVKNCGFSIGRQKTAVFARNLLDSSAGGGFGFAVASSQRHATVNFRHKHIWIHVEEHGQYSYARQGPESATQH